MLHTNLDTFLSELTKLFENGRQTGRTVWITMKRYDGRTTRNPRKPNDKPKRPKKGAPKTPICEGGDLIPDEYKCLIRAKLGDRRISAAIGQKDMNKFQQSYSNLIKGNIYSLKNTKQQQQQQKQQQQPQQQQQTKQSGTNSASKKQ